MSFLLISTEMDSITVTVRLFSNRSRMMSKYGKIVKKVAHEAIAEDVTDVLTMESICVIQLLKKQRNVNGVI